MKQRIITGLLLTLFLAIMLWLPGWCMALATLIAIGICVWEEYHALNLAGHNVVTWPAWVALVASVPLSYYFGVKVLIPLFALTMAMLIGSILWRKEPEVMDMSLSVLPMMTVVLPGLCLVHMSLDPLKSVEVIMLLLTFCIPLMGDVFALFVGSAVGKRKLCPKVSPKKTVEGALGGLAGSVIAAMLICLVAQLTCREVTLARLPRIWHYPLLGLFGGIAGQMGDLFASLVKRHSGIKDFSNLFPGHGGMLDRLDSVLFMAVLMYCYRLFTLG